MKVMKIHYTVREDFVDTNKENIRKVMEELRYLNNNSDFLGEDGKTFIHFVILKDESSSEILSNLESFKNFRKQLDTGVEVPPKTENLNVVNSSFDFFKN